MAKSKAENLDDVLALARVRRQSGMLTIEHTQGGRVEEGELYLDAGQPVYARVGQLVGQDALNWLSKWRNVYFTITTGDPKQPVSAPVTEIAMTEPLFPPLYHTLHHQMITAPQD